MEKDVFRRLQEQLDQYFIGFPATDTGIEIEMLKAMFTEEEAAMFTSLTAELEMPASVAGRLDIPIDEAAARLEDMAQKGLLYRRRRGEIIEYGAIPFMHGLVEFQIERIDKNTLKLLGQYFREGLENVMWEGGRLFVRTIPVQRSVETVHHVAAYDDACQILRNQELIAVTDCACRRNKSRFERDCGKPIEVCFMFGPMGQYYIENGLGREIDLDEALQILTKAQEAGLVTQPATSQNPFCMCNCCGDCCGFLSSIKRHPRPAEIIFSNYQAVTDHDKCSGCETCLDRCQMDAVRMDETGLSKIDPALN